MQLAAHTLSLERDKAHNRVGQLEDTVQSLRTQLQVASDEAAAARQQLPAGPTNSQHLRALTDLRQQPTDRDEQFIAQISSVSVAVQALTAAVGSAQKPAHQRANNHEKERIPPHGTTLPSGGGDAPGGGRKQRYPDHGGDGDPSDDSDSDDSGGATRRWR